jgi:L-2,4-diaminobutyrate transaminase
LANESGHLRPYRSGNPAAKVGARLSQACLKRGLIARAMPHGDILGLAPPLIAKTSDVDEIVDIIELSMKDVVEQLAKDGFNTRDG